MNIKVVVNDKKPKEYKNKALKEYQKRLSPFCSYDVLFSDGSFEIQKMIDSYDYTYSIDKGATYVDSISFSKKIQDLMINGKSSVLFLIGYNEYLTNKSIRLTESKIKNSTKAVLLTEQIYRCFTIINNKTYHK